MEGFEAVKKSGPYLDVLVTLLVYLGKGCARCLSSESGTRGESGVKKSLSGGRAQNQSEEPLL